MRRSTVHGWSLTVLFALSTLVLAPALAATVPIEKTLNGVTLKSTYIDVLMKRGLPHYIGPSLGGADVVLKLLDPGEAQSATSGKSGAGTPYIPRSGRSTPGGSSGALLPPGQQPADAPPAQEYMIWVYEGNDDQGKPNPAAGWTTYVLFSKFGEVAGVVTALHKPTVKPPIKAGSGVTFGTRLTDIVKEERYGWPQPFLKIGSYYFLPYPDRNVAFVLAADTRRVVQISIGLPLVVSSAQQSALPATATPAGGRPAGKPGVLPTYPEPLMF